MQLRAELDPDLSALELVFFALRALSWVQRGQLFASDLSSSWDWDADPQTGCSLLPESPLALCCEQALEMLVRVRGMKGPSRTLACGSSV